MRPEEQRAAAFLRDIGLKVEVVPTGNARSCDFRVRDSRHVYLVEVKLKNSPDVKQWDDFDVQSRPVGLDYGETQRMLRYAASQMSSTRQSLEEFAVPWVTIAKGADQDILLTQTVDTFFGVERIGEPPYRSWKRCYFFGESIAFRHREISGMIVDAKGTVRMCLNPFSTKRREFRTCDVFRFFAERGWMIDPVDEEQTGVALFADCEIDRRDERRVLDYIKRKYNLRDGTVNLVMQEHSSVARVPVEELESQS